MGMNVFPQSSGVTDLTKFTVPGFVYSYPTLVSNSLTTFLSITGKKGILNYFTLKMNMYSSFNLKFKITIDGVVKYFSGFTLPSGTNGNFYVFVGSKQWLNAADSSIILVPTAINTSNISVTPFGTSSNQWHPLLDSSGTPVTVPASNVNGGVVLPEPIVFNDSLLIEFISSDTNSPTVYLAAEYATLT